MPSQFELLPREIRDHIYGHVLPRGRIIIPFYYPQDWLHLPTIMPEGILTVNRKIHAEAVALLYLINTFDPAAGFSRDKMRQKAITFWRRRGSSIQYVHMDMRLNSIGRLVSDEYYKAIIVPKYAARVWKWERTALREAANNNLQTLTLEMRNHFLFCPKEYRGRCSTPAVIAILHVLLKDLTFRYGTLQLRRKDRVWTCWEGSREHRSSVEEGEKRGTVNHLIICGSESLSPVIDEVRRFLGETWSLLNTEVRDDAASTQVESESTSELEINEPGKT